MATVSALLQKRNHKCIRVQNAGVEPSQVSRTSLLLLLHSYQPSHLPNEKFAFSLIASIAILQQVIDRSDSYKAWPWSDVGGPSKEGQRTDACQRIFLCQGLNPRLHECGRLVPLKGDQVRHNAGDMGSSLRKTELKLVDKTQGAITTLTCDVPDLVAVAVSLVLSALMMLPPGANTPMADP